MKHAMGWIPDYPDFRDYTEETEEVREILKPTGLPPGISIKKPRQARARRMQGSQLSNTMRGNPTAGTSMPHGCFSTK
jgi:hypothetical protein